MIATLLQGWHPPSGTSPVLPPVQPAAITQAGTIGCPPGTTGATDKTLQTAETKTVIT